MSTTLDNAAGADLDARLRAMREGPEYQTYLRVRDEVLRMRTREAESAGGVNDPSAYWRDELSNFDYMLDASPLIVAKLRHHCYHVTGIRTYEYRSGKAEVRKRHEYKLDALRRAGDPSLFVPESPILGGFGFETDGGLYNVDTLKYFESLIALDRGAVLSHLRAQERPVIWEIGAGWGGLAHQLKTLIPNATYVISDFPELYLFSAVYLMTAFPEAKVAFHGADGWREALDSGELDFLFMPNTALDDVRPPRLDLTLNTVSFQEMTTEQVDGYAGHAASLGCPLLYSLNRERSYYNDELIGVPQILERHYWLRPLSVLPISYTTTPRKPVEPAQVNDWSTVPHLPNSYRHIVGWLRRPGGETA